MIVELISQLYASLQNAGGVIVSSRAPSDVFCAVKSD